VHPVLLLAWSSGLGANETNSTGCFGKFGWVIRLLYPSEKMPTEVTTLKRSSLKPGETEQLWGMIHQAAWPSDGPA